MVKWHSMDAVASVLIAPRFATINRNESVRYKSGHANDLSDPNPK